MQVHDSSQIFLSYASPDHQKVTLFFEALADRGFNVWYDRKKLKPGQNWNYEILRAIDKSAMVIIFLSNNSVSKRGYVQKELKIALDKRQEKLVDDIYLIPVLLDDKVTVPHELREVQCISADADDCIFQVEEALNTQLDKLGFKTKHLQTKEEIRWSFHQVDEDWDGLPGYRAEIQFIKFQSTKYPRVNEIGEYIQGQLLGDLFFCRKAMLCQDPQRFNYGQDKYRRSNSLDIHCTEPSIKGRVISIMYTIYSYYAGAAHPNTHFQAYSFVMEPLILVDSLKDVFLDSPSTFPTIQELARSKLKAINLGDEEKNVYLPVETINNGTKKWSNLRSFIFTDISIELFFSPYQVAPYAFGPQHIEISYYEILELIRPEYKSALNIEYMHYQKNATLNIKSTES